MDLAIMANKTRLPIMGQFQKTQAQDPFLKLVDNNGQAVIGGIDSAGYLFGTLGAGQIAGVTLKTDSYQVQESDAGYLISVSKSSGTTLTLPVAAPVSPWFIQIENTGSGSVTVDPNGLNIDGSSSTIVLAQNQGLIIFSDGTNYFTQRGVGSAGASGFAGVSAQVNDYTAQAGDTAKLLSFNKATSVQLTLPGTAPSSTWFVYVQNVGAGTLTISRNGKTIDGAASNLTVAQNSGLIIYCDGTNYFTDRGISGSGTGTGFTSVLVEVNDYTALTTDSGKLISFNKSSAVALTLPVSAPGSSWCVSVQNIGTGDLTINRNGLTIDGAASNIVVHQNQGLLIYSDGSNYFTERGWQASSGSPSSYLGWKNVMDYGAIGDGVNDDGPAIQAAVNAATADTSAGGGRVYFPPPPNYYIINTTVVLPTVTHQIYLYGDTNTELASTSQFTTAPRIRIFGTATPLISAANCAGAITLENIDLNASNGCAFFASSTSFLMFRNSGVGANYNANYTDYNYSAPMVLAGEPLWFKAVDTNFTVNGVNTGPFKPSLTVTSVVTAAADGTALYKGTFPNGRRNLPNPNVYTGMKFTVAGFSTSANNGSFVCQNRTFVVTSVDTASAGSAVYHGTFTDGGSNTYAGSGFRVVGFTNSVNNGLFFCTASTATTLTLSNANATSETHAASANGGNSTTVMILANGSAASETHAATAQCSRDYDPSSWNPPAFLINASGGAILFDFEFCTWTFGGCKMSATVGGANGITLGEIIFTMNVLEGTFGSPMFQYENDHLDGQGQTCSRIFFNESQLSDLSNPTALCAVKGFQDTNDSATLGSIFCMHAMAESGAIVQQIGTLENITGVWHDDPQVFGYNASREGITKPAVAGFVHHSNQGVDTLGPAVGPISAYLMTASAGGSFRGAVPDPTIDISNTSANFMIDADGSFYLGPGGSLAPFDILTHRLAAGKYGVAAPVAAPTGLNVTAQAGGTIPDGNYYVVVAAGDRNNSPNAVSAASVEFGPVTLGGGNNTLRCTWTPSPTNPTTKYSIYVGTTPGGENKCQNVTSNGGPVDLTSMPVPNQVPQSAGNLLADEFIIEGDGWKHNFGTAFTGFVTAVPTAARTWTLPDATGTLSTLENTQTFSAQQNFAGGVKVGSGGTVVTHIAVFAVSLTPGSMAADAVTEEEYTVTGITTSDKVFVNNPALTQNVGIAGVRVSNTNKVTIAWVNPTSSPHTPDAGVYTFIAIRS
jgi:Pectate lyase superfamily protein